MTHEELLAKIDTLYNNEGCTAWVCEANYKSIRAVVELHKPKDYAQDTPYPYVGCMGCGREYPCSTIQAIEKELA